MKFVNTKKMNNLAMPELVPVDTKRASSYCMPKGNSFLFRIRETIEDINEYDELLEVLETASELDDVHIKISSIGGRADIMQEIVCALKATPATVTGEIVGSCMSAATVIFLSCHNYMINENIEWMSHNVSYGVGGKENDIYNQVDFTRKHSEEFVRSTYTGFHSEGEIQRILKGEDIYLNSKQVMERMESFIEYKESNDKPEEVPFSKEDLLEMTKEEIIEHLFGEETFEESPDPTVDKE